MQANYWRMTPTGHRRKKMDDEEEELERPSPGWMIICWTFGGLLLWPLMRSLAGLWTDGPGPLDTPGNMWARRVVMTACLSPVLWLISLVFYFPLRNYLRARREYQGRMTAVDATEKQPEWAREADKSQPEDGRDDK